MCRPRSGANVPAVNELLDSFGIAFGSTVYSGALTLPFSNSNESEYTTVRSCVRARACVCVCASLFFHARALPYSLIAPCCIPLVDIRVSRSVRPCVLLCACALPSSSVPVPPSLLSLMSDLLLLHSLLPACSFHLETPSPSFPRAVTCGSKNWRRNPSGQTSWTP